MLFLHQPALFLHLAVSAPHALGLPLHMVPSCLPLDSHPKITLQIHLPLASCLPGSAEKWLGMGLANREEQNVRIQCNLRCPDPASGALEDSDFPTAFSYVPHHWEIRCSVFPQETEGILGFLLTIKYQKTGCVNV